MDYVVMQWGSMVPFFWGSGSSTPLTNDEGEDHAGVCYWTKGHSHDYNGPSGQEKRWVAQTKSLLPAHPQVVSRSSFLRSSSQMCTQHRSQAAPALAGIGVLKSAHSKQKPPFHASSLGQHCPGHATPYAMRTGTANPTSRASNFAGSPASLPAP